MIDYIALKQYVLQEYRLPETFLYVVRYLMNRFIVIVVFMAIYVHVLNAHFLDTIPWSN